MPMWEYTAKAAATGQILKGQLDVPSRDDVISFLRRSRMTPVVVREAPKSLSLPAAFTAGIKTRDVVIFTRQFTTMIERSLVAEASLMPSRRL